MPDPVSPLTSQDLVLCDFDGTISVVDTGLLVAETLGLDRFDEIEQSWRRGEISARECLRDQWRRKTRHQHALTACIHDTDEPDPEKQVILK